MVVHLVSVGLTVFLVWLSSPGSDLFSWHPACMSVAFALLLLQAVVVFSPESSLFPTTPRPEKVQVHWILHAFGIASAAFGFGTVYLNKEVNNRQHFTTWHGKFGLVTVGLALVAIVGGIAANYSSSLRSWIRPVNVKLYHATLGMIVFLLAMTSMVLATYSNWFRNRMTGWPARITFWAPIVLAVCVARQVTQSYLPRILSPRESELDSKARQVQQKVEEKLRKAKEQKGRNDEDEDKKRVDPISDSQPVEDEAHNVEARDKTA